MWPMPTAPTPWCITSSQGADSAFDITFLFIFQTPVAHCDRSHFTYWAQALKPLLFWIGTVNQLQMPQSNHLKRLSQQGDVIRPGCTASPLSIMKKMFLIQWCTESDLKIQDASWWVNFWGALV
jgi:hypothetical protein